MAIPATKSRQKRIPLRSVALPAEHGSWGLALAPIVVGLLVVPSWPGAWLALGMFAAFLLRQPLEDHAPQPLAGQPPYCPWRKSHECT